jgi:hypothetical protein
VPMALSKIVVLTSNVRNRNERDAVSPYYTVMNCCSASAFMRSRQFFGRTAFSIIIDFIIPQSSITILNIANTL